MNHPPGMSHATAAAAFAALGSEQRLGLLKTLVRAGPGGLTVGALGDRTGLRGATLTHHLKILAQACLIVQSRHGRSIVCVGASYGDVRHLSDYLMSQCCADAAREEAHAHD